MGNVFVWSGATGANDGTTWEDAYTTLASLSSDATFDPTAGDICYVRSSHAENVASVFTLTTFSFSDYEAGEAPVKILSVAGADTGTSPGALTRSASINTSGSTNDINIDSGNFYIRGIDFDSGDDTFLGTGSNDKSKGKMMFEDCTWNVDSGDTISLANDSGWDDAVRYVFKDCTFDFQGTTSWMRFGSNLTQQLYACDVDFWNCTWTATAVPSPAFRIGDVGSARFRFIGCDLSGLTGTWFDFSFGVIGSLTFEFIGCKIPASFTLLDDNQNTPAVTWIFRHCEDGTSADPSVAMEVTTAEGKVSVDTARYRTGGASDGERTNPVSWEMDTGDAQLVGSIDEGYSFLESPTIEGWVDGDGSTAKTLRFYLASGATQNDDDVWVDVWHPNESDTSSQLQLTSSRITPLDTPAALTTDSGSTWTGTDVSTKQYIDITFTPDKPGPVMARWYLAKPSERVSVSPMWEEQ